MAWEWLAPVGTVVGSMITAGVGAYFGSKKTQERQHKFEHENAVLERGREKADQAIEALRTLQKDSELAALLDSPNEVAALQPAQRARALELGRHLDQLGRAIEYLTDPMVRAEIDLVHDAIRESGILLMFGEGEDTTAQPLVWCACREGLAVLGRYVRNEPPQPSSAYMKALRVRRDTGEAELERQIEESRCRPDEQRRITAAE
ncbi:hypothetical protein [Saccharothrix sp. Mg75]|uniref:hypothetical protein n=1 Tax=Saccharothrix sp. Mg75 TaxID=3445357 RepID=UPI003EE959BB